MVRKNPTMRLSKSFFEKIWGKKKTNKKQPQKTIDQKDDMASNLAAENKLSLGQLLNNPDWLASLNSILLKVCNGKF